MEKEQLLSGVCEVCTSKVLVENTALRERMKRMEEALQRISQVEPRFLNQQEMFDTAQAALKEGGE